MSLAFLFTLTIFPFFISDGLHYKAKSLFVAFFLINLYFPFNAWAHTTFYPQGKYLYSADKLKCQHDRAHRPENISCFWQPWIAAFLTEKYHWRRRWRPKHHRVYFNPPWPWQPDGFPNFVLLLLILTPSNSDAFHVSLPKIWFENSWNIDNNLLHHLWSDQNSIGLYYLLICSFFRTIKSPSYSFPTPWIKNQGIIM